MLYHYYVSPNKQNLVNNLVLEGNLNKLFINPLKAEEDTYQKKEGHEKKSSTIELLLQKIEEVKLFTAKI